MLFVTLISQIVTGLMLSIHYNPHSDYAMARVNYIMRDIHAGWFVRNLHVGGARLMFVRSYIHIGRGMYYGSYLSLGLWYGGLGMFVLLMATAFLGYVLPWGVLSYWAAVVIVNMFTIIPFVGKKLTHLIWGGYVPGSPTLKRFFILHFMLPFVMLGMALIHVYVLHTVYLSNSPLGIQWYQSSIPFYPYYVLNDWIAV